MNSALREKAVLALLSTTRPQCVGHFGLGEARCALGLIGEEVFGFQLRYVGPVWDDGSKGFVSEDHYTLLNQIGWELGHEIATRNNNGATFDDIAKFLKELPIVDDAA